MVDGLRMPAPSYLIGIDLAQGGSDWTALTVLQRSESPVSDDATYECIWLERWRDRMTTRIPLELARVWKQLEFMARQQHFERTGTTEGGNPEIKVVVDQTGVGPFGTDPLRRMGFNPIGIVIHGGDAVSHPDDHTYRVPKRDLAGVIHTLLESDRLRVAPKLFDAPALRAELENFRVKISLSGHDRYEAGSGEEWRVGAHDDLVLAVAVAAWMGEYPTDVATLTPVSADMLDRYFG